MNIKTYTMGTLLLLSTLSLEAKELRLFQTKGCGYEPKNIDINSINNCCVAQQLKYWQGGTNKERSVANDALYTCVLNETNDEKLAALMKKKETHSAYSLRDNRWGNGWSWGHFYKALKEDEKQEVLSYLHFLKDSTDQYLTSVGY